MDSQNESNSIEITLKKEKGFIIFGEGVIKISENLSSVISGDISKLTAEEIITRENNFYFVKIGHEIKLKIKTKIRIQIRNQKYTLEFGIGWGFFSRSILKFKDLNLEKYHQMLHMLETNNIFSKEEMKEFEEFANDRIHSGNSSRNALWGSISLLTLVGGLVLIELLTGNYRIVLLIYYILNGIYFLYNLVFYWGPALHSNPEKQRKIHITQKIARNLYLFVITFVYLLAFIS
jgi:hypothetical protein